MQATSDSVEAWFDRAVEASHAGRHEEAETAFHAVLALVPDHGEAQFGLGLSRMAVRRFAEAIEPLKTAASETGADPVRAICLGQALYMTGAFDLSAQTFDAASRQTALPSNARLTHARARTFAAMIDGDVDAALAGYPRLAGQDAEDVMVLAEEALSIFGVFNLENAARAVGRWVSARRPDDAVLAYRVQVLEGAPLTKATAAYVAAHFDAFADRFDHQLAELLDYDAPQRLTNLVASHRTRFDAIVDIGCGTGLAAPRLARFGGRLTGVDLSAGMLAKAAERGGYDDLVRADAAEYLLGQRGRFDLIFAADVLIYLGDLSELFTAAARALRPGGVLAITTEIAPEAVPDGWKLLSSGRFSHSDHYIDRMAFPAFDVIARETIALRREGLAAIDGRLHLLTLSSLA